jgi:hypothetical protein
LTTTTTASLFSVVTVARKGGKPNVEKVLATSAAAAAKEAIAKHRAKLNTPEALWAEGFAPTVAASTIYITPLSVKPVSLTVPKPTLNF